jgi:hypothetical protein
MAAATRTTRSRCSRTWLTVPALATTNRREAEDLAVAPVRLAVQVVLIGSVPATADLNFVRAHRSAVDTLEHAPAAATTGVIRPATTTASDDEMLDGTGGAQEELAHDAVPDAGHPTRIRAGPVDRRMRG